MLANTTSAARHTVSLAIATSSRPFRRVVFHIAIAILLSILFLAVPRRSRLTRACDAGGVVFRHIPLQIDHFALCAVAIVDVDDMDGGICLAANCACCKAALPESFLWGYQRWFNTRYVYFLQLRKEDERRG